MGQNDPLCSPKVKLVFFLFKKSGKVKNVLCLKHTWLFEFCPLPCCCWFIFVGFPALEFWEFVTLECDIVRNTLPTALVRPSRNTMRCPGFMYSGCFINRKCTRALSPVLRQSCDIVRIEAVCLILPQWTKKYNRKKFRRLISMEIFFLYFLSIDIYPSPDSVNWLSSDDAEREFHPRIPSKLEDSVIALPSPFLCEFANVLFSSKRKRQFVRLLLL